METQSGDFDFVGELTPWRVSATEGASFPGCLVELELWRTQPCSADFACHAVRGGTVGNVLPMTLVTSDVEFTRSVEPTLVKISAAARDLSFFTR